MLFPALHLQPSTHRETSTADVSGGTRLHYRHRPPLHHQHKTSKRRFLIDTGSDLCVFPRKLIPQRRLRIHYDHCAANGTTIPTYGWLPLSLNLGMRRDFTWRFVVADVTQPLIGADFLSHFGLLVECRNNRLLDGVTSLSTPAQGSPASKSSVEVHRSTPSSPSIRLSLAPREFSGKCATTPSTTSGLHQAHQSLADHRLTFATAEFDAMVCDGTARPSEFLALGSTHRAQEGQRMASLRRL
jgi:hypothetical protein